MPKKARLYISFTVAAGITLVAGCLIFQWQFPDLRRYVSYLLLAIVASTLKVRLPEITGTMSVNFLFILIGIAECTFAQTLLMGCAAALVQCMSGVKRQPKPVQIAFNVAVLAISIGLAYPLSHLVPAAARTGTLVVLLVMAACLYFVTNTVLVSAVLSLTEQKPLKKVWQQCHLWSFPYYLVGAAMAGLYTVLSRAIGWEVSLLVLPMMYLVYVCYRLILGRVAQEPVQVPVKVAA